MEKNSINEQLLKLQARREIYGLIQKYPGLHLRELSRKTSISYGTLRYHLNYMVKRQIILSTYADGFNRYYLPQKVGASDKQLLNIFRQEKLRKIIFYLLCPKGNNINIGKEDIYYNDIIFSIDEIPKISSQWAKPYDEIYKLDMALSTLNYHLKKLVEEDIVECIHVGKKVRYKIKDLERILNFLITYEDAFSDELFYLVLKATDNMVNGVTNRILNKIFDVFPHPYHI